MTQTLNLTPDDVEKLTHEFVALSRRPFGIHRLLREPKTMATIGAIFCVLYNLGANQQTVLQVGDLDLKWLAKLIGMILCAATGAAIGALFAVIVQNVANSRIKSMRLKSVGDQPRRFSCLWDDERVVLISEDGLPFSESRWDSVERVLVGQIAIWFLQSDKSVFFLLKNNLALADLPENIRSHIGRVSLN
jgi:hypothetical protein